MPKSKKKQQERLRKGLIELRKIPPSVALNRLRELLKDLEESHQGGGVVV